MPDDAQVHTPLVKLYRTDDRITAAVPLPGLEPEDIAVEITADGQLAIHGALRGLLKGEKAVLLDEWNPGPYHRLLALPVPVDGPAANLTYGNGVLVVALPVAQILRPAQLTLPRIGPDRGERAGNAGRPPHPATLHAEQHD